MIYINKTAAAASHRIRLEWRILTASLVIGFTVSFIAAAASAAYSERVQGEIAAEVMRFHVLANSDSPEDQAVKLLVRDGVLAELSHVLTGNEVLSETREILQSRLGDIERWAEDVMKGQGIDYPVRAFITKSYFPTRTYENISLPAGVYENLRLEIGEGAGRNWWCVVFPPLCFVDIATETASGETASEEAVGELQNLLTAESYDIVANTGTVKVKFKIVELWQELKNKLFKSSGR